MNKRKIPLTSRRGFLRTVTSASLGVPALAIPLPANQSPLPHSHGGEHQGEQGSYSRDTTRRESEIKFPRTFTGRNLSRISFPLGGIGAGGIGLGGRGNLMDWEIFNRPDRGNCPQYAFPSLWVRIGNRAARSVVLERRFLPPYDVRPDGLGSDNVPGLPRLAEASFMGSFPLARIEFRDNALPVQVSLEAFPSFEPADADLSGLPCAILSYEVRNPDHEAAEVVICWTLDNPTRKVDHTNDFSSEDTTGIVDRRNNEVRKTAAMHGIQMTDPSLAEDDPMKGSFVLAVLEEERGQTSVRRFWRNDSWSPDGPQRFWFDYFSKTGDLGPESEPSTPVGAAALRQTIPAGESRRYRFLLSWHFHNRTPESSKWEAPKGKEQSPLGNYYCTRFSDAWSVAEYVQQNWSEIENGTRGFVDTLQSSTLPAAVLEAASANLSTLVSNTSFRIADGSFHGFEGCGDSEGWGFGTCTHVWNYEVATQFLFPVLARSIRGTSFGYATAADGRMDFRHKLPLNAEHWGAAAADGQMGQIIKLYLDWKVSGETTWLRQLWPACRRALAFAWIPGGWDSNRDGVMEGAQHTTYDVEFYGPNPLCEVWYLAALRATAEMAAAMDDSEFAADCQRLYEQGSRWTDAHLFNGEYYIQLVRGIPESQIADGLRNWEGSRDTVHPKFQLGSGCLVDQLLGQYMADLAGLGPLLDVAHVRKALQSIYLYNYRRDLSQHASVGRTFSLNDEAALVVCNYPEGARPEIPIPYCAENFTGSEYAAAILMLKYGMVDEGVECIANIRRRYDGERANPYAESEFGRHYVRALASWGAIPMLSGFSYNAVTRELDARPLIRANDFCCFWSTPTAWGSLNQAVDGGSAHFVLKPNRGSIAIQQLKLDSNLFSKNQASVEVGGVKVPCVVKRKGNQALFGLTEEVRVSPSATLVLTN
jgi:non-lysosomal glucosylceramidase